MSVQLPLCLSTRAIREHRLTLVIIEITIHVLLRSDLSFPNLKITCATNAGSHLTASLHSCHCLKQRIWTPKVCNDGGNSSQTLRIENFIVRQPAEDRRFMMLGFVTSNVHCFRALEKCREVLLLRLGNEAHIFICVFSMEFRRSVHGPQAPLISINIENAGSMCKFTVTLIVSCMTRYLFA